MDDWSNAREVHPTYNKLCPVCDTQFEDDKPWGVRCSDCRETNQRMCENCGVVFTTPYKTKVCFECEVHSGQPF